VKRGVEMLEMNSFIHGDCMEYLPKFPDKYFDLAVVDPPYGINIHKSGRLKKYNTKNVWDNEIPSDEYFSELFRVSKNQIVWGGNYFNLPPTKCFLIWDKKQPEDISFASCEFAWTSFGMVAKTFYFSPFADRDVRIHTTQKPVALYEWILSRYANKGDKILDTHVGSASSLIACHNMGFEYIGFEKDEHYYNLASQRLEREKAQMTLFDFGIDRMTV
jgi:site-specific DNA-methyltransferase (adenine-specific)